MSGAWLYPADGVNLPRNTPSILFQWASAGGEGYQLEFRSPTTQVTWTTRQQQLELDAATWATIASSNAGGEVQVFLRAAVEGTVLEEPPRTLRVNRLDAEGSVIYWSTGAAGFVEIPYGEPARDFLTQAQTGRCLGCHAISRTGQLAFTWDGGNGALGLQDLEGGATQIPPEAGYLGNFKTFSPDGRYLLATENGHLQLFDAATGALLSRVRELGDMTHVDWSPDGTLVALTWTDGHSADWALSSPSRVAVMEHLGEGRFSELTVLVQPPKPYRAYYPAWSPDGRWLAYNLSTGDAYDDPDAELWVVDREATRPPVRLDQANGEPLGTNSWPRWGPLPDDDVLWLTFASKRPYGAQPTEGRPQIWVAAFDPERATVGLDPSWPAFWLPGQPLTTGNHIPVWVDE
jgi:dipeptidyl aminopeptidase/acylaminoacyl peptidase